MVWRNLIVYANDLLYAKKYAFSTGSFSDNGFRAKFVSAKRTQYAPMIWVHFVSAESHHPSRMKWKRIFQTYLDKSVIYPNARWGGLAFLLALYALRVYLLNGF
jgi:hypothetical protein